MRTIPRVLVASALALGVLLAPVGRPTPPAAATLAGQVPEGAAILAIVGRQVAWLNLESPGTARSAASRRPANALDVTALPDATGARHFGLGSLPGRHRARRGPAATRPRKRRDAAPRCSVPNPANHCTPRPGGRIALRCSSSARTWRASPSDRPARRSRAIRVASSASTPTAAGARSCWPRAASRPRHQTARGWCSRARDRKAPPCCR